MIRKALAILIISATSAFAGQAELAEANNFVQATSDKVISILKSGSDDSEKEKKLTEVFTSIMDIDWIARFAIGKNWQGMSTAQQNDYLANYRKYIISSYVPIFKKYNGQSLQIKNVKPIGNDQFLVVTEIKSESSSTPYKVEYRVKRIDGAYRVRDIVAEGISLINTQRSDFGSIVAERGISALNQNLLAKAK
jgi:phospholipid transport system substrate-binding protein